MALILNCIGCGSKNIETLGSLGKMPNCNKYEILQSSAIDLPRYELDLVKCVNCDLVQVGTHLPVSEVFSEDYPYFSSYSKSWLEHCSRAAIYYKEAYNIGAESSILEIGSNDGYFLKYFSDSKVVIGVEPTKGPAEAAIKAGIKTKIDFFNHDVAAEIIKEEGQFDLVLSNNMLAHTPDLRSVLSGVRNSLKAKGKFIVEVQYASEMFLYGKFDTVYHEHFCYYTISSASNVFKNNGLYIFDAELLNTHGGSIRLFASKENLPTTDRLKNLLEREIESFSTGNVYKKFFKDAEYSKINFLNYIEKNGPIVGYGAPTKGNVFLNYCGLTHQHIKFTSDMSPLKENRYCPGSGIPVYTVDKKIYRDTPSILIFPWNIKDEIIKQFDSYGLKNKNFITAIPKMLEE
ncbi:class I SAM-dependent methyltransferase [Amylibacter sp.]|nr:class I SAM-dependent methyltransferase [Amylibacter sp.]